MAHWGSDEVQFQIVPGFIWNRQVRELNSELACFGGMFGLEFGAGEGGCVGPCAGGRAVLQELKGARFGGELSGRHIHLE